MLTIKHLKELSRRVKEGYITGKEYFTSGPKLETYVCSFSSQHVSAPPVALPMTKSLIF